MNAGADLAHRRARAAFGMVAILVAVIAVPSAGPPVARAELSLRVPFDSNGRDDSFAVAMSRPQGPLIGGPEELELQSQLRVATAAIPDSGDPVRGSFGAQVAWPIMPIHAVLLPDGRVLTYGTDRNGVQTAYFDYDVWTPTLGTGPEAHNTLINGTQTDIFCSSQIVLVNGDVELYGGDNLPASTNTQNRDVNQYLPATDTLVRTGSMHRLRWYSTAINLPNGEVYIQGGTGGADFPEVRDDSGQFRLLTGASTNGLSSGYPRNFVAPNGLVFSLANKAMNRIDPAGTGTINSLGTFPTDNAGGSSTAVMFAPGRILQVGGGSSSAASRNASVININGATPQVTALPQVQFGRHWANATVMADGRVLLSGGSAVNNAATGVAYTTELFNPATNTWSSGPTATRMRLYHSTSLLLPDASLITMGGGTPGPETNLNAEIYFPPYLFNGDGTRAARPTISAATAVADPATTLTVESPDAASISRVTLVKVGSVTHSFDMDQRFLELSFTRAGTTLQATLPANVHETPPGYYMVFAHAAGVPSEAAFVKINVAPNPPPPPTTTTTTTTTSSTTTTTTLPPTTSTTTSSTSTTSTSTTTSSSTTSTSSTTTTTTSPPTPPPTNLVVNGGFENNPVAQGSAANVSNLQGWTNPTGAIEVWRNYSGMAAGEGSSNIELDRSGNGNRAEQVVVTQAGRTYTLSFMQSPRPGVNATSNRFDVYWNSTRLGTMSRNGNGLTQPSWQTTTFTVTGTGNDRISFRESDSNNKGALIDNVRLIAT